MNKKFCIIICILCFFFAGNVSALGNAVTLSINPDHAAPGDSVTLSGTADGNIFVTIKVVGGNGDILFLNPVKSDDSGDYSDSFIVPSDVPLGVLSVIAGYGENVAAAELNIANALTGTAAISGNAVFGETLTAVLEGSNNTGTLSYQWMRGDEDIAGATDAAYTLGQVDIGKTISVKIASSAEAGTLTSAPTASVDNIDPAAVFVSGGIGTEADPYRIASAAELECLAQLVNSGATDTVNNDGKKYASLYYRFDDNIDLGGVQWTPIGADSTNSFTGTLDGNGKVVSNLTIGISEESPESTLFYVGLFGYTTGATIQNVGAEAAAIYSYNLNTDRTVYAGGLAGYAESGTTITECYVTGAVSGDSDDRSVAGGLVGYIDSSSTIADCYTTCCVSGFSDACSYVGGLVGYLQEGTITNSYATGSVGSDQYAGGLVGTVENGTIINSYATGSVSSGDYAGGLAGFVYNGTVTNSHATGNVEGLQFTGGLAGQVNNGTVTNSYATGNVVSGEFAGGFIGSVNYCTTITNNYATGNVEGHDYVQLGSNYYGTGGFAGSTYDSNITYGYWNTSAVSRGVGSGTDTTIGKTREEMADPSFIKFLNDEVNNLNDNLLKKWKPVCGENDGYPMLNGLGNTEESNLAPIAVNTAISGLAHSGQTLIGSYTFYDVEGDTEVGTILKWYRANDSSGTDALAIPGATGSTYTPTDADVGYNICFEVTPSDGNKAGAGYKSGYTCKVLSSEAWDGIAATEFADGSGTEADPYQISSAAELAYLAQLVNSSAADTANNNGEKYASLYYELTDYIQLGYSSWIPIGTSSADSFTGTLDGNGKVISNLTIGTAENPDTTHAYAGLFGYTSGATIQNVGVEDAAIYSYIAGTNNIAGSLVGWASGDTITNCFTTGIISIGTGGGYNAAGGLVGYALENSSITNSYAAVNISGSGSTTYAGGFAGITQSGSSTSNCYAIGNVMSDSDTANVGGLVGTVWSNSGTISNGYWNSSAASNGVGSGTDDTTSMEAADMKNTSFVTTLNSNVMALMAVNDSLRLKTWKFAADKNNGYPMINGIGNTVTNTAAPTATHVVISGLAHSGQMLATAYDYCDLDGEAESGTTYKWYRASDASGTDSVVISGATGNTYTLTDGDVGYYICFEVTPANSGGAGASVKSIYTSKVLSSETWDGTTIATEFAGGSGTEAAPYQISSAAELVYLAQLVNSGAIDTANNDEKYAVLNYELTDYIKLGYSSWTPIGTSSANSFTGTFDGNSKVIANLTIGTAESPDTTHAYAGLFGYTSGATIQNVGVEDAAIYSDIAGTNNMAGGLVGWTFCDTITNCFATGTISVATGGSYNAAGGLAGYAVENSSITNSYAAVNISGSGSTTYAGGLAGITQSGSAITNSYAVGNVTSDSGTANMGGLLGAALSGSGSITNCYATGSVSGGDSALKGGFAGKFTAGSIDHCYWNSSVASQGVGSGTDDTTGMTADEMKSYSFAEDLNEEVIELNKTHPEILRGWELVTDKNDGYPMLNGVRPVNALTGNVILLFNIDSENGTITGYRNVENTYNVTGGLKIPDTVNGVTVTKIGDWVFTECEFLANVIIPDSVTSIGEATFANCGSLASVTIQGGVVSIGMGAFADCRSLESVTIQGSNLSIGDIAFAGCGFLTSAYFEGDAPASFGNDVFKDSAEGFTIYYPSDAKGWEENPWHGYPTSAYTAEPSQDTEILSAKAITDVSVLTNDGKTLAEIKNALGNTVVLIAEGDETVNVPVTWGDNTEPEYNNGAVNTYVLTGTIGQLPDGYKDETDTVTEVTVNIVVADAPVNALIGTATITGNAVFDETLTAVLNNGNNTGTLSYQWTREGIDIAEATNEFYTLVQEDIGTQIGVTISSSVESGSVTSTSTAAVEKADCETAAGSTPVLESKTHNSVTLVAVDGYEYTKVADGTNVSEAPWQDSNEFNSLTAETDYDCYQRVKETATHKASTVSEKLDVTTDAEPALVLSTVIVSGSIPELTVDGEGYDLNQLTLSGQDQNGNSYDISGLSISWQIAAGSDYATLSGSILTPANEGVGTVTATVGDIISNIVNFTVTAALIPSIEGVILNTNTHEVGSDQQVEISITCQIVADGTNVIASLVDNDGNKLNPEMIVSQVINNNHATVFLNIQSGIPVGEYKIKVKVEGIEDAYLTAYQITEKLATPLVGLSIMKGSDGNGEEMVKDYNPTHTDYRYAVEYNVEEVKAFITAAPDTTTRIYQDNNEVTDGTFNLVIGQNNITIVVSEAGLADRIYHIGITRMKLDECFIATAAYGSKFEPSVKMLRQFRDKYLLTTATGKSFVAFYYRNSPPIAKFIGGNQFLKLVTRLLLCPFILLVYLVFHPVLGALVIGSVLIMLIYCRRRFICS